MQAILDRVQDLNTAITGLQARKWAIATQLEADQKEMGVLETRKAHLVKTTAFLDSLTQAVAAEAIENSKPFVCECKTTSAFKFKDWSEDDGRAPDHILIQAQSQLLVTGADLCRIICLIGGQRFCKVEVYPSDELQNMIIEHVEEFMERVHALDPPPATFRSTDALKLLYPTDDGSMVLLPPESVEWLAEYQELTAKIKESTEDKDELGNKLKAAIGECTFGVLPCEVGGKTVLKYAVEEKQEYTVRAQSNRVLRQLKQLGKGKK